MADEMYQRFGRDFPAGHVLFRENDSGREMFVIQAGQVRISKTVRDVDKVLVTLGPGEFFGEMSILNGNPRSATATVEQDAKLLVIDPRTFEAMVRGNAEIAVRIIKKLAARLQEADEQIENLLLRDHKSRVVHLLATLAAKQGRPGPDGIAIDVNLRELAGKMGLAIEAVDEGMNMLVRAKLGKITERGVVVAEAPQLREFLGFLEMKEKFRDV